MANGLFGGPTADEVRNKLRLQQQLLNQKRIADAQIGLTGPARFAAKAAAESEQALSGISRGLMQGAGELFGIESLKRKEDPLVSKALKRDKDRTEILGILESYRNDSASPGIIDQNEMKQGFALLMSRGYPDEAKMFLEAAQKEMELGTKRLKAQNEGRVSKQLQKSQKLGTVKNIINGEVYTRQLNIYKDGTREVILIDKSGSEVSPEIRKNLTSDMLEPTNADGLTSSEVVEQSRNIDAQQLFVKDQQEAQNSIAKLSDMSRNAREMLKLLPSINSGVVSSKIQNLKNVFGLGDAATGQFNNLAGRQILRTLSQFGRNPTEGERKFTESMEAGLSQGRQVNEAILRQALKFLKVQLDRASYLAKSTTTLKDYRKYISKKGEVLSKDLEVLSSSFAQPFVLPANLSDKSEQEIKKYISDTYGAVPIGLYFRFENDPNPNPYMIKK